MNGDHFGAYGDPPTNDEINTKKRINEYYKHKEWLDKNISNDGPVVRILQQNLRADIVAYIVKCLEDYRP